MGTERLALDGFPATEASDLLDAIVMAEHAEHHTADCPYGCYHPEQVARG